MGWAMKVQRLSARSEPTPRFEFDVWVQVPSDGITRTILAAYPTVRAHVSGAMFDLDTRVASFSAATAKGPDQGLPFTLQAACPFDQLGRLDAARRGSDPVRFEIDLGAVSARVYDQSDADPDKARLGAPVRLRDLGEGRHEVSRDEWIALLATLKFRDVLVFEFATRAWGAPQREPFVSAMQKLEAARRALSNGEYDGVAHQAFLALESLATESEEAKIADALAAAFFSDAHPELRRRFGEMAQKAMPLIHVGRHAVGDNSGPIVEVSREHASWILGNAELIVGWCVARVSK